MLYTPFTYVISWNHPTSSERSRIVTLIVQVRTLRPSVSGQINAWFESPGFFSLYKTSLSSLICVTWGPLQNMQGRCKCWPCQVSKYSPSAGLRLLAFAHLKSGEQSLLETRGNFLGGLWLLWWAKLCLP